MTHPHAIDTTEFNCFDQTNAAKEEPVVVTLGKQDSQSSLWLASRPSMQGAAAEEEPVFGSSNYK